MALEIKELAKEFSTSSRSLGKLPHQDKLVEVSPLDGKVHELDIQPLRFLHYLKLYFSDIESSEASYSQAIDRAAFKAGVTRDWAESYLKSKEYRNWVSDRLREIAIREGLTVEWLMRKHRDNVEGRLRLKLSQLQSLSELGERLWPKTQRIEHQVEAKDSRGMEEMLKVREEVEALEEKLKAALEAACISGG